MTEREAYAKLPETAKWSCCFGNPGDQIFSEMYRDNGKRYEVGHSFWVWFFREVQS